MGLSDIDFSNIEAEITGEKRFLDIGCATGKLLEYLKKRGWSVKGVELCEPSARFGIEKRGLTVFHPTNKRHSL